jgi:hypothetical protein
MNQGVSFTAEILVRIGIGQHKPQAVADAILAAMNKDNNGQWGLIRALNSMGPAAQSAVPKLLQLAKNSASGNTREEALKALVAVGDKSPEVLGLICHLLENPGFAGIDGPGMDRNRRFEMIDLIAKFGAQGQAALPSIKKVMDGKITANEKGSLERALQVLQLPDVEKTKWLSHLENVPMKQ